jgi:hypothetical protein
MAWFLRAHSGLRAALVVVLAPVAYLGYLAFFLEPGGFAAD